MPGTNKRSLHPLLLERSYWRNRLQELELARQSVLLIPRPELSSPFVEVDEFRIRAHDGVRLFGLRAQCRLQAPTRVARIRIVGPSDLPEIDREAIMNGESEFVFQEPAGRKLEDRVLDVLRICRLAAESCAQADRQREPRCLRLLADEGCEPDEFLIASQLLSEEVVTAGQTPLDDGAGWGVAH
jgi:hypothetical protein